MENLGRAQRPLEARPVPELSEADRQLEQETREFLDSLDEDVLRDIFERELRLSGVASPADQLDERFVPFSEIKIDGQYEGNTEGSFHTTGGIRINSKPILQSATTIVLFSQSETTNELHKLHDHFMETADEAKGPYTYKSLPILRNISTLKKFTKIEATIKALKNNRIMNDQLMKSLFSKIEAIHTVVHEELHAISNEPNWVVNKSGSVDEGSTSLSRVRSGFNETSLLLRRDPWQVTPSTNEHQQRFTGLDEGVTELNARRLSREYLTHCLPDEILGTDITAFYDLIELGSYNRERWVAEQLVLLFSTIAEVPTEIVERSLFRSYLNGGDFLPEELVAAVRHDVPELSKEQIEQLLLKLQIAISSNSFYTNDTDINRIFVEFADLLPTHKRDKIKDGFQELFYKYNFAKELQDEVVET